MRNLFRLDNPVMQFLSRVCDLMIVNVLFWLCCLPVVTVGASLTALHKVTQSIVLNEDGGVVKPFFRAFRGNFRQATAGWLVLAVFLAGLAADLLLAQAYLTGNSLLVCRWLCLVLGVVVLSISVYYFHLVARYENTVRQHAMNAAILALVKLPRTVLMVLLIAGACAAGWFLYDPISAWLTEKAEEHQQRQEQQRQEEQNQNQPGNPENPGTTDEPTTEQTALPESCAVLDTAVLYDMAALENRLSALAAKGYTGAVFTLKDEDGLVLYQSALEDVTGNTAQTAQRYDLPAVIAKIKAAGLTPVGRLWAFDDHTAGRKLTDATVKYNYTETNWIHNDKEAGGHTWLNPMSERAQGYILSLLGEAADNGLEVLILEGVQFPTGYSLNLATYAEKGVTVDKSKVLADFTAKAAAAMKARNVSLWTALWLGDLSGESVRLGGSPLTVMASAENCLIKAAPEQFATRKAPLEESIYTVMHPWWSSLSKKLPAGVTLAAEVQGYAPAADLWQGSGWGETQRAEQIRAAQEAGAVSILLEQTR